MQKIRNIKKNLLVLSRKKQTSILGAAFKKTQTANPDVKLSFLKSHLKFDQHSGGRTL